MALKTFITLAAMAGIATSFYKKLNAGGMSGHGSGTVSRDSTFPTGPSGMKSTDASAAGTGATGLNPTGSSAGEDAKRWD